MLCVSESLKEPEIRLHKIFRKLCVGEMLSILVIIVLKRTKTLGIWSIIVRLSPAIEQLYW